MRKAIFAMALLSGLAAATAVQAQPYGYGPGMMGGGYGPGGMMGPGYGGGYGPGGMMGPGYGGGYGPGWMMRGGGGGGYGMGPGMMYGYGYANEANLNLTADQVKRYLEQMIRNPNLKVGDVKEKDTDTVVAEIVTKQGNSLVQKLNFNRHNGFVQPEQ